MRMTRALSLLFAAALSLVSACGPAQPAPTSIPEPTAGGPATEEPVALKVGILNFMSHAPFIIAQEEGYFTEEGLDVELINFISGSSELNAALHAGQIDAAGGTLSANILNAIAQGSTVRAVADKAFLNPQAKCATDAIVARKAHIDAGLLDDLSMLRGMKTAISAGSMSDFSTTTLLEETGLTYEDLELTNLPDYASRVEAFRSGSLDFAVLTEPWLAKAVEDGTVGVVLTLEEALPNYSSGYVYFSKSMYARESDVGVRFMTAYLKAVAQYNEGKTDRNVELLSEFTQLEPDVVRLMCWPSFRGDGMIDLPTVEVFERWAVEAGHVDSFVPVENIWDPQFVEAAAARLGR